MRSLPLVPSLCAVLGLIGCSDPGTGPPAGADLTLTVVHDGQLGLPGEVLADVVGVRVRDGSGRAVVGRWVRFEVEAGGGAVLDAASVTDLDGVVTTPWRLGPSGAQRLRARLDDGPDAAITATSLPIERADVVVVHGATLPLRGVLLVEEEIAGLAIRREVIAPDTVVRFVPQDGPGTRVVVLPSADRPLQLAPAWTPGPDTVHVTLEPPVEVDLAIRVFEGDFATQQSVISTHLDNMERAWKAAGLGAALGDVTFEDLTSLGPRDLSSQGICPDHTASDAIVVTYVRSLGGIGGYGCTQGYAYLGADHTRYPYLLAHEIGHTFSLQHVSAGMMYPSAPGSTLTDGEVYRANFDRSSALNTVFGAHPPEARRTCGFGGYASPCLPIEYVLPPPLPGLR